VAWTSKSSSDHNRNGCGRLTPSITVRLSMDASPRQICCKASRHLPALPEYIIRSAQLCRRSVAPLPAACLPDLSRPTIAHPESPGPWWIWHRPRLSGLVQAICALVATSQGLRHGDSIALALPVQGGQSKVDPTNGNHPADAPPGPASGRTGLSRGPGQRSSKSVSRIRFN
jgi:hypothetical protein